MLRVAAHPTENGRRAKPRPPHYRVSEEYREFWQPKIPANRAPCVFRRFTKPEKPALRPLGLGLTYRKI